MINLEEKIRLIENSNDISELTLDVIPPTYSENYYFVSYSHKDYKKVYKDILLLQSKGISLWYDRGMRPGKDWKEIAETMIDKFACKGVIFFVSENLVASKACAEEMEYVNKIGKSFCSINLAASDNSIYSAAELCEMVEISDENKKIIETIFPPSVLYLSETDPIEKKIEGILKLKEPQLLSYNFHKQEDWSRLIELGSTDIYNDDIPEDDLEFISNGIFHYANLTFSFNQDIKTLHIPSFVYSNIDGTFCEELTEDSIKNKVTKIDRCCFANSRRLTDVIMSDSIESIGESAFQGCINLENFIISKKVEKIDDYTFHNCSNLLEINLSNVKRVGANAFSECRKLTNIKLESCSSIGSNVFYNCLSLKEIKLNVSEIPEYAFYNCQSLENITLLNEINSLGTQAFYSCNNITNIETTFNVETIPYLCFYGCKKLKNIRLSDSLTLIEANAFLGCRSLESFNFSKNIEIIGTAAFDKCESLEKLHFNDNLIGIEGVAFNGCKNVKEIHFGKNLSYIGVGAFNACISLKEVIFPENIEIIGNGAFARCTNLKKITIPKSCKTVSNMLSNNPKLEKIIYTGTVEEWCNVNGYNHLISDKEYYEVICSNGVYINK